MPIADLRFLAVEDHEFQRGILLRILAGLGARKVEVAADGRAALEIVMAPETPVDIIISDLDMPGMDGMEFIRRLGESDVQVALILASGLEGLLLDSAEQMTRDYGVRVLGVIAKPVTPAKLDVLIRKHTLERSSLGRRWTVAAPFSLAGIAAWLTHLRNWFVRLAAPSAAVDRSVLAVVSGGNAAVEQEILAEFRRVNDEDAVSLEDAVAKRNIAHVTSASERIRGACRTVGAVALASVCERLERASGAGDWTAIEADLGTFRRELQRINSHCDVAAKTAAPG